MVCGFVTLLSGVLSVQGEDGATFKFTGGDAERGKMAFQNLNCIQCHQVKGVEFERKPEKRILSLSLGKEIRFVKNYQNILTAITNPQHVVTKQYAEMLSAAELAGGIEAFMPKMTQDMSVEQLIDIALFLHEVYSTDLDGYTK